MARTGGAAEEEEAAWRRELVDAAVRRHERLATHMSVGMVGHAQALQRLLHPALTHLLQLALDAIEAAARIRPPSQQAASSALPAWVVAVLRVVLRCVRLVIRALRRARAALLVGLLRISARVQAQTTRSAPPQPPHTGGGRSVAAPRASHGSRLRQAVAAKLSRSLDSVHNHLQVLLAQARQQCGQPVAAPQYASFLLFVADVAAVLKTGSFPEELCLGLRRQPLFRATRAFAAQPPRGRLSSLLRTLVPHAAQHAAGLGAALFRAWLRQAEDRSTAVACVRDAVELGVLVTSALQLRSYTSLDAVLFSAGVTDAVTAREAQRQRRLAPATAHSSTQTLPSREELDAWIAQQQREHLLGTASPARRAVSTVASTLFAAVPPLVIGALPRIVEWLDRLQQARGERRLSIADRALGDGGFSSSGSQQWLDGSLPEEQRGTGVAEGDHVPLRDEQTEEDDEDWDQEGGRESRRGGLDPAQQRQQPSFYSILLGVADDDEDVEQEAESATARGEDGQGEDGDENEAALPSPHETVAAALDVKDVMNRCALCRRKPVEQPCVVPTAGMLCCMPCAVQAARDANNRCPFTGHPLNPATQLIRIYDGDDPL